MPNEELVKNDDMRICKVENLSPIKLMLQEL